MLACEDIRKIYIYIYICTIFHLSYQKQLVWSRHVSAHYVIISDVRLCSITASADFRFYRVNPCVQREGLIQPYQESMIQTIKTHVIQVMIKIAINNQCHSWSTACYLIFCSLLLPPSICWTWFRLGHAFKSPNVLSYKALGWRQVMPISRNKGDKGAKMTNYCRWGSLGVGDDVFITLKITG